MIARPDSIPPEVWAKIPPGVQAAIAILGDRDHCVAARINRNGSVRYSVDGSRDMDAATMARRYKI